MLVIRQISRSSPYHREPVATDSVVAAEVAEDKECYLQAISKDGPVIAFLFRCRHCGTHLAYSDFS